MVSPFVVTWEPQAESPDPRPYPTFPGFLATPSVALRPPASCTPAH